MDTGPVPRNAMHPHALARMHLIERNYRMGRALRIACLPALLALAAILAVSAASSQAEPGTRTLKSLQSERVSLAKSLSPSIVAIAATRPDLAAMGQTGMAGGGAMAASGFVVDGDFVMTCMEGSALIPEGRRSGGDVFMKPGTSVWMMAHDGTEFSGTVVGRDRRNLALLVKMDEGHPDLPSLKFGDSDAARMGTTTIGLGNTLDSMLIDRTVSFSYGTVSGFYRFEPLDVMNPDDATQHGDPYKGNVLEVDVAIHPGDHGGPVVNLSGEVIGMMTGHFMAGRYLGCTVPSNQLRAVMAQLKKGISEDELARGKLGFIAHTPAGDPKVYIKDVEADGPAAKAGIKVGMELVRVDNYRIPNWDRLKEMLGVAYMEVERTGAFGRGAVKIPISYGLPVGTHIQLTLRDPSTGKEITVDLVVGEKDEDF